MYILPPSISKKIEGYRWQSFTPPAAGKSRRFRGLICHRRSQTAEVCRNHGISPNTFYKWKAKYGGLDISDARKLKSLETENGRLKRLLADTMLDNVVLKDLLGKN